MQRCRGVEVQRRCRGAEVLSSAEVQRCRGAGADAEVQVQVQVQVEVLQSFSSGPC